MATDLKTVRNFNSEEKSLSAISMMLAGALGASLGMGLWLSIHPVFSDPIEYRSLSNSSTAEETLAAYRLKYLVDVKNHGVDYGALGLALGIVTGIISGGRRRVRASIAAGIFGFIGGTLGGMACTVGIWKAYEAGSEATIILGIPLGNMAMTMLSYAVAWGLVGLGVGFGLCTAIAGIVFGSKGAIGGAVGGVAASMTYIFVSAFAFPYAKSFAVIPDTLLEKMLWVILGGSLVGLCITLATGNRKKTKPATATTN